MCVSCGGKHHTSICTGEKKKDEKAEEKADEHSGCTVASAEEAEDKDREGKPNESGVTPDTGVVMTSQSRAKEEAVLLQTALVTVSHPLTDESVEARILFDLCSQRTYITKKLCQRLKAPVVGTEPISVGGFGGNITSGQYELVKVGLKKGLSETIYVKAAVIDKICSPIQGQRVDIASKEYEHLYGLQLADASCSGEADVQLMVGADIYWSIMTGETVHGNRGPVAMGSIFGYVLSGPSITSTFVANQPSTSMMTTALIAESRDGALVESLNKLWDLESVGIREETAVLPVIREDIVFRKDKGMYEVGQVWKQNHEELGDNFLLAKRRTFSSVRSLQKKDTGLLHEYNNIMAGQLKDGVLEVVSEEMAGEVGRTYYMPHQLVVRRDKETTKVRVVYDCSSKMKGYPSLNDCLQVPEALYTDLFAVMVRFRCQKVGLIADIEKAFLRILMKEEDRDAHRLIWVKDPFAEKLEPITLRFTTVTFGAGPSMWHLGSVIQHHLSKYTASHPDTVAKIEDSLYADDFSGGERNDEKAIQLYREGRKMFREAGMNLRKWKSNSRAVMQAIIEEEEETDAQVSPESYANLMLNPTDRSPVKVLGTPWDLEKDELSISLENAVGKTSEIMTKVQLLSVSSSIFDVKGLLAPVVFFVKTLFQQVCKEGGSWEDRVGPEVQAEWDKWIAGARKCMVFEVPRCLDPRLWDGDTEVMLVGFSDASKKGFAAVVYLRVATKSGDVTVNLIASKTRVAPLVEQSIPRLELLSALILTRLIKRIRDLLQKIVIIEKEYCLIDSAVALHWIQNLGRVYKQYVQDRADECRRNAPNALFRHIPGTENSADLPSRGCTPDVLDQKKDEWFHSQKWVKEDESSWPTRTVEELVLSEEQKQDISKEIRKKEQKVTILAKDERSIEKIIDPARYSTFTKLLRVTALVLKFIDMKCKRKEKVAKEVSAEDLDRAKDLWVRHLQKEVQKEQKFKKMAESLGVQEDTDGYLRCKGRLGRSKLPFDVKHPLLLPSHHRVTELIIWDSHDRVYHDGVKETLADLRSQYWISKGRQRVKTILRKCRLCKLLEGLSYPVPTTADLPEVRLDGGRVFKYTGVDFCGPVYVKTMYQKKDQDDANKAYILVFTCATSRMIHLELCPDLSTEAYIRGQKRFMGRRGSPSMIISDNGRTFKGRALRRFNAAKGIRWRFNLARAPWWGGMFERMVRSTKRCLKKAVGSRRLTYEELNTVLVEIEAVLNSRPLTYIYEDDVEVPLTPSHLFCGRRLLDKPEQGYEPEDDDVLLDRKDMITQTKGSEAVVDHFWKRWSREYLVDLREHQKTHVQKQQPGIGVGDVVLIEDDGKKRNNWRLGRIEDIVTGKDGVIRGANVRTANGKIGRPLQKIYPLEVREDLQPTDDGTHVDTDSPLSVPNHPLF